VFLWRTTRIRRKILAKGEHTVKALPREPLNAGYPTEKSKGDVVRAEAIERARGKESRESPIGMHKGVSSLTGDVDTVLRK
jgi:hypothetical protein